MDLILKTKTRTLIGKKNKRLRKSGVLPAVIYGHGIETRNIEIKKTLFQKFYKQVDISNLFDLIINDQEPVKVLIQEIQKHPIKNDITHVDFYQINKNEKITHSVKLNFIGEAKAVKELNGMLIKNANSVEIECLPEYLISEIDIDISSLNTFEDFIYIKDIKVSSKVKILDNPDKVIAVVSSLRKEEAKVVVEEKIVEKGKIEKNKKEVKK